MTNLPIVSGRSGNTGTALDLIERSRQQIEEVARFRTEVRDYRAPRMEIASTIEALTLLERGQKVSSELLNITA